MGLCTKGASLIGLTQTVGQYNTTTDRLIAKIEGPTFGAIDQPGVTCQEITLQSDQSIESGIITYSNARVTRLQFNLNTGTIIRAAAPSQGPSTEFQIPSQSSLLGFYGKFAEDYTI